MRLRDPQKAVTYSKSREITDTKSIEEKGILLGFRCNGRSRPSYQSGGGESEKGQCISAGKVWEVIHNDCFFGHHEKWRLDSDSSSLGSPISNLQLATCNSRLLRFH